MYGSLADLLFLYKILNHSTKRFAGMPFALKPILIFSCLYSISPILSLKPLDAKCNTHVITEELPDETAKITASKISQFGKGFTIHDDDHRKENTMTKQ
jgi:hypothetical protein